MRGLTPMVPAEVPTKKPGSAVSPLKAITVLLVIGVLIVIGWFLYSNAFTDEVLSLVNGPGYDVKETFEADRSEIRGYVAADVSSSHEAEQGQFYFVVRPENETRWAYAYRVDRQPVDTHHVRLAVCLLDVGRGDASDAPEPPRIFLTKPLATGQADYEAARALVQDAEKAAADWDAHKRLLDEAFSRDPETAHEGWRKIAADLERAHERHPNHLGILKDLIVAYTQLNSSEIRSHRGTNLSVLIPQRIAEYKWRAVRLTPAEEREFHKALAVLYFQTNLYPLASVELDRVKDDPETAILHRAMEAIGQAAFSEQEVFGVEGELATYTVTVYQSSEAKPPEAKMLFHHLYFVPRLQGAADSPSNVWYTLSSQTLTKAPRYYLYGHKGNQRRLLMMYGTQKPGYETVKAQIQHLMSIALTRLANEPAGSH